MNIISTPERRAVFMAEYQKQLRAAVAAYPEEYPFSPKEAAAIAVFTGWDIDAGTFSHAGRGFKWTCAALGIKHSRKAIVAFLSGVNASDTRKASA